MKVVKDFSVFMAEQTGKSLVLTEGYKEVSDEQYKIILKKSKSLEKMFMSEIDRIFDSGVLEADSDDEFPLSTIFKYVFENFASGQAVKDKKAYKALKNLD